MTGVSIEKILKRKEKVIEKNTLARRIKETITWMMITMDKKITKKELELVDGKDIFLERGEKIFTFKNKITGEILYSTNKYSMQNIQGKDFIPVFKKPSNPKDRRVNLILMDAIDRVKVV
jgi:hypothetical protein